MTTAARHEYAGIVSRSVAYVVDALIVVFGVSGGIAVMGVVAMVAGAAARDIAQAAASAYVFFLPAVLAVYCAVFWLLAGRTPGMALLGVRVMRSDGRPVGWLGAFVRGILLALFPIGSLWLLVDRRHQAVHDKVVRTVVVRDPGPSSRLDEVPVRAGSEAV
ncbi:RDD family protein [Actinoplanes sp. TBRC 11911]|uniref:RDD family protein n=1 Tax=Actinoplanes sp. TBRC 11911 TaxID=2729386 RepID=UPI00145F71A8|nr:RDD family protein [Actinoplanes sp. TBRC 11911]NMO52250.1 RDD family protein [Actinoplanes sp. TBRC 11911]